MKKCGFFGVLYSSLASVRLALVLIVLLIVSGIIGAVFWNPVAAADPRRVDEGIVRVLQLYDVFSSPWFIALVSLFALNLVLCALPRFARTIRSIGRAPRQWRRWRNTGPDLVHIGLLLVLTGGFLGVGGGESLLIVPESDIGVAFPLELTSEERGLSLRVDGFGTSSEPGSSAITQYWTDVVVLDDAGRIVSGGRVEVNRPLTIEGMGIYQSNYGLDPARAEVRLALRALRTLETLHEVQLRVGTRIQIEDTRYTLSADRFYATLTWTDAGPSEAQTATPENPATLVTLWEEGSQGLNPVQRSLALLGSSFPLSPATAGPYDIALADFVVPAYTGLLATRSPGYPVAWWGGIVLIGGLILSFLRRGPSGSGNRASTEGPGPTTPCRCRNAQEDTDG